MKRNIDIIVANPAGNITIFVLDKFPRADYQNIATQLLAMKELKGEQVSFVTGENSMEMCGLEFCGNASRAFALLLAKHRGLKGSVKIDVNISGCEETLTAEVNTDTNYTKIKMPMPLSITELMPNELSGITLPDNSKLVDFGGIMHILVQNLSPTIENFNLIKDAINAKYNPPAMGVMFYDTNTEKLTPVVYVKDVDTTYFEGSCGSGSTAVAAGFAAKEKEGSFSYTLSQPQGTITATVEKSCGAIDAVYIEGPVSYDSFKQVEITI